MSTTKKNRYAVTEETVIGPDIDLDTERVTDAQGERITEASTEAFTVQRAEEARRGGRPSLGSKGSSPSIAFRIPPELRAQAEEVAEREGRTISAIAREQLERYVESRTTAA